MSTEFVNSQDADASYDDDAGNEDDDFKAVP